MEFITPLTRLSSITTLGDAEQNNINQNASGGSMFKSILDNAIDDVKETNANVEHNQYLLATGQLDDPHTLTIATTEATLSLDLLIQLRNKSVEAYNELLRINL